MILFKRFLNESRSQWALLLVLVVVLIGAALFEMTAPRLLGHFVDAIVQGLQEGTPIASIINQSDSIILGLPYMELMQFAPI